MKLSPHFTLRELTDSATARTRGLSNAPNAAELANLQRLAAVLEDVRRLLGNHPILVSSGFRSTAVNGAVGGAPNSAHRLGLAADFTCPAFGPPIEVCRAIADSSIPFDQVINEYGRWVHFGLSAGQPRRQVLTIDANGTRSGL